MHREPLELYIHIPFCVKKCQYCDFLSFGMEDERLKESECHPTRQCPVPDAYIEALCREIQWYGQKKEFWHRPVISVFFGGGTPSLMSEEQIRLVMSTLHACFLIQKNAEITMEANPGTLTPAKLKQARQYGINRLSIGLQSTDENELKVLGRIHSYGAFLQSFKWAREADFKNINVDVITAVPNQTEASYKRTLEQVLRLQPEHISAYSLIIEPDTPFETLEAEGKLNLPDEDEERKMYHLTRSVLKSAGYDRYEISNYAKKGFRCRHNIGYWRRTDYLGLGLGASSLIGKYRFSNTSDMEIYLKENPNSKMWYADVETLSEKEAMEEFMFLGLRMIRGVREKTFYEVFGKKIMAVYGKVIEKYRAEGLLQRKNGRVYLTENGLDVANQVMADFLLDKE